MKKLSNNIKQLIKLLNDGEFHSGNELGDTLKITRSAIWKMIKGLELLGITFETHKSLGYRLEQPLKLLDGKIIKKQLVDEQHKKNCKIDIFASITSTIDYLKEKRNLLADDQFWICLAEHQSKGRGRLNRSWYSPFGASIYFSMLFQFDKDMSELAGFSLVIGLAIIKTLKACGIQQGLQLKWPNDILWSGQKLCGNIIDVSAESHGSSKVIVSLGLNTNMPASAQNSVDQPFSSVNQILNQYQDRNVIIVTLITHLMNYIKLFNEYGLGYFKKEWHDYDFLYGKMITLINPQGEISGKMIGINDQGHLLLELANKKIAAFSSGDTTIKKG